MAAQPLSSERLPSHEHPRNNHRNDDCPRSHKHKQPLWRQVARAGPAWPGWLGHQDALPSCPGRRVVCWLLGTVVCVCVSVCVCVRACVCSGGRGSCCTVLLQRCPLPRPSPGPAPAPAPPRPARLCHVCARHAHAVVPARRAGPGHRRPPLLHGGRRRRPACSRPAACAPSPTHERSLRLWPRPVTARPTRPAHEQNATGAPLLPRSTHAGHGHDAKPWILTDSAWAIAGVRICCRAAVRGGASLFVLRVSLFAAARRRRRPLSLGAQPAGASVISVISAMPPLFCRSSRGHLCS